MNKIFAIAFTVILSGCVATSPINSTATTSQTAENKAPKWEPLVEGSDLATDVNYKYYPEEMKLNNDMLLRGNTWNGFLKKYIESFPINKRDAVLRGLSRYYKEYDKVEKNVRFEPLRYMSGPYSSTSYVSMQGSLTHSKANALLKFLYYGNSWIFAHSITVSADDFTWKSAELKFYRNNYSNVWEYSFLDISKPQYRKIADKIVSSKEVIIRFNGNQYYYDLQVTERMKQDISAMLKAVDAINGKA